MAKRKARIISLARVRDDLARKRDQKAGQEILDVKSDVWEEVLKIKGSKKEILPPHPAVLGHGIHIKKR